MTNPLHHLLFGLFGYVVNKVPGVGHSYPSSTTSHGWRKPWNMNEDALGARLEGVAKVAQELADANAVTFDTDKSEAIVLSCEIGTSVRKSESAKQKTGILIIRQGIILRVFFGGSDRAPSYRKAPAFVVVFSSEWTR